MGSHLGWHFAVCCPLRGGRGEFIKKTPKTIKEKKKKKSLHIGFAGNMSHQGTGKLLPHYSGN
jgi:hypothetical protein